MTENKSKVSDTAGDVESVVPEQCSVTCADFSMCLCKESHRCVLDSGHPFDAMCGEIHRFVTHMLPVEPRVSPSIQNTESGWLAIIDRIIRKLKKKADYDNDEWHQLENAIVAAVLTAQSTASDSAPTQDGTLAGAVQHEPVCILFTSRGFHDWRWLGWPLADPNCQERWCLVCGLRQVPVNGEWLSNRASLPESESSVTPTRVETHAPERIWVKYLSGGFHLSDKPFPTTKMRADDIAYVRASPARDTAIEGVVEALREAKELIRVWHVGGVGLGEEVEAELWRIYDEGSPEMKRINSALATYEAQRGKQNGM